MNLLALEDKIVVRITVRMIQKPVNFPIQANQYSVPYITISAVLPSTKIADMYDMNMDSATGITPSCLQKDSKSRTDREKNQVGKNFA